MKITCLFADTDERAEYLRCFADGSFEPIHSEQIRSRYVRYLLGRIFKEVALSFSFTQERISQIQIVINELIDNVIEHTSGGSIEILACRKKSLLALFAHDKGPAISNLELAFQDGCTADGPIVAEQIANRGGIGAGLGAVRRFSDAIIINNADRKTFKVYFEQKQLKKPIECPVGIETI